MDNAKRSYPVRVICLGLVLMLCCGLTFMVLAGTNGHTFLGFMAEVFVGNTLPVTERNMAMLQLLPMLGGFLLVIGGTKKLTENSDKIATE